MKRKKPCCVDENYALGLQIQALRKLCGQYKVDWGLRFQERLDLLDMPQHPIVIAAIAARTRMIEGNLGLVRMACRGQRAQEDLFQEGVVALIKAIDGYHPQRGPFSTYAASWIRGAILDAAYNEQMLIREPRYRRSKGKGQWKPRWRVVLTGLAEGVEGID